MNKSKSTAPEQTPLPNSENTLFDKLLKFFIDNYKINYTLFFLLFAAGIYTYTMIPKEISPEIEPDTMTIRGSYGGASVDVLNRMVVTPLEEETKNLVGVESVTSVIAPGSFSVRLELEKGADKAEMAESIRDAIALVVPTLPSDMDEPAVRNVAHARGLMQVSVRSDEVSLDRLRELAQKLKSRLMAIPGVSDVTIFGDSDLFYEIMLDERRIDAYGLSHTEVLKTISELSYIYPLGKIDDAKAQYFLSVGNQKKFVDAFEQTVLNIGDRQIALRDIATVSKRYEDASTLASMNGKTAITLSLSQNPKGDAIAIGEKIYKLLESMKVDGVDYDVRQDQTTIIQERLNIVISNILFGIILITLMTFALINARMAFIIALGIPTSFVLGSIYFYFTGYSININSLIGVIIAIGIIVDDAIVVSENIQQYIEKGYAPAKAAFLGTREMAKPVTIASATTLFSFIPLLMISGRLGEIVQMIPIAFSALVIASLLESFIFLPIHAVHLLSPASRTLSWKGINRRYSAALGLLMQYQKTFLLLFVIIIPLLIYTGFKHAKFQMFQPFDATALNITFKAAPTTTLEESLAIVQAIEKDLLKEGSRFGVENVTSTAGYRRSATGDTEMFPSVGYIGVELQKKKPDNFMDSYITPYLSFYESRRDSVRERSSKAISKELRAWLVSQGYKERFGLEELMVVEKGMGYAKADIRIGLMSEDYQQAIRAVKALEAELGAIDGIKYAGDNIKRGIDEIKIKVNAYGEQLGITDAYLGNFVSDLYLSKRIGVIFDGQSLLDIKVRSAYQDDFAFFESLGVPLKNGQIVRLKDVCDFEVITALERLVKDDGETTFFVFANVDSKIITASEALQKLEPTLRTLRAEGVRLKFKGEAEQKKALETDLVLATVLSVILIFIAILYLFNSIRETLIVVSVIPFSLLGVLMGHTLMGLNLSMPSLIGALGLAGVIVNDGIIMMSTLRHAGSADEIHRLAGRRFRPIILTSLTTLVGLSSLIFFASGQAATFQPLAVSLGFGLAWGTVLNLFYLPVMYSYVHKQRVPS
ncbi:efflux RND transporter permease subunit [Sulfurimonas sp. HSL-3221]|uniref:efflux RND transporter permease subunit n=1 Tax=Sulfurimonadaceae TaxID=2771471 RepID=UPI001E3DF51E|nr:efflux RND transporter permease subunit [Sulfurimonas sp. HSL-3221]UFS63740.1 efflux RND transporter permease subunit [Sulfurimonas sp. HSL-3221]